MMNSDGSRYFVITLKTNLNIHFLKYKKSKNKLIVDKFKKKLSIINKSKKIKNKLGFSEQKLCIRI